MSFPAAGLGKSVLRAWSDGVRTVATRASAFSDNAYKGDQMGYRNSSQTGSSLDSSRSITRTARAPSKAEVRRALWEREMRRLRLTTWVLAAVLLALIARSLILGLTVAAELSGPIVAGLLLAAVLLTRQGRRIEPHISGHAKHNPR